MPNIAASVELFNYCCGVMARKGKETDVQVFVKTDEEWEKLKEPQVNVGEGEQSSSAHGCIF